MRVISGSARGRRLTPPRGSRIRPTADRVKEAIFNLLVSRVGNFDGLRVLDLFCGSGALGIEALSRGAEHAVFVDSHGDSLALARRNVSDCRLDDRSTFIMSELPAGLRRMKEQPFDVVFLDPPYRKGLTAEVLEQLPKAGLLAPGAVVVTEQDAKEPVSAVSTLVPDVTRTYGDTAVSIYIFTDEAN